MSSELFIFNEFICGLPIVLKLIVGVEGKETDGEPRDAVMTEYGEPRPFIEEPRVLMGECRGREELMTDG